MPLPEGRLAFELLVAVAAPAALDGLFVIRELALNGQRLIHPASACSKACEIKKKKLNRPVIRITNDFMSTSKNVGKNRGLLRLRWIHGTHLERIL
jgi:hypothetical protein